MNWKERAALFTTENGGAPLPPKPHKAPLNGLGGTPPPPFQELKTAPRVLHLEDIMALPIMPCTTCIKFKWGRRPSCEKYQSLADPRKGCRCVHYAGRLS